MADFSKINGYNVKDANARERLDTLEEVEILYEIQVSGGSCTLTRAGKLYSLHIDYVTIGTLRTTIFNAIKNYLPSYYVIVTGICDRYDGDQCVMAQLKLCNGDVLEGDVVYNYHGSLNGISDGSFDEGTFWGSATWLK